MAKLRGRKRKPCQNVARSGRLSPQSLQLLSMRPTSLWTLLFVGVCTLSPASSAQEARVPTQAWAPKPIKTPAYTPPQKPWVKLSDLKARHQGQSNWRELLVDDGRLTAEYFSSTPGTKLSKRFHPDTREWFAVVEGEIRVEIEGQETFTATRGSLVNIPRQTIYSLETVSQQPSLRFVVNVARAKTLFVQEGERLLRRQRARPGFPSPSIERRGDMTSSISRISTFTTPPRRIRSTRAGDSFATTSRRCW